MRRPSSTSRAIATWAAGARARAGLPNGSPLYVPAWRRLPDLAWVAPWRGRPDVVGFLIHPDGRLEAVARGEEAQWREVMLG